MSSLLPTCEDMCPVNERLLRSERKDISRFETIAIGIDKPMMIKKYRRSAANSALETGEDVRTPEALLRTVQYIESFIMVLEFSEEQYLFIWDRFRSIAKDFLYQSSI